jgi:hypothetical protein
MVLEISFSHFCDAEIIKKSYENKAGGARKPS